MKKLNICIGGFPPKFEFSGDVSHKDLFKICNIALYGISGFYLT